jgi:acetate kinase
MRSRIAGKLAWLGADLDSQANAEGALCVSRAGSKTGLYVVPTNEELMIARHTLAVLSQTKDDSIKRTA